MDEEELVKKVEEKQLLPDVVIAKSTLEQVNINPDSFNSTVIPDLIEDQSLAYKRKRHSFSSEENVSSRFMIEKLLGSHDLGLNGMTKCFFNFMDYTDYFIGAFECIRCLEDTAQNVDKRKLKKLLQKKILTDIQSSIEGVRPSKLANLQVPEKYHCIMCAIVETGKVADAEGFGQLDFSKTTELMKNCKCGKPIKGNIITKDDCYLGGSCKREQKEREERSAYEVEALDNMALHNGSNGNCKQANTNVQIDSSGIYPLLETNLEDIGVNIQAAKDNICQESDGNRGMKNTNRIE